MENPPVSKGNWRSRQQTLLLIVCNMHNYPFVDSRFTSPPAPLVFAHPFGEGQIVADDCSTARDAIVRRWLCYFRHKPAMPLPAIFAATLALLAATTGANKPHNLKDVNKCCNVYQMLSADGKTCVEAPWPRNTSFAGDQYGVVLPPLDREWLRRWLPPGLQLQRIRSVYYNRFIKLGVLSSVNASSFWDPALLPNEDLWKKTVSFTGKYHIARPKPGGGVRKAVYCVDAAMPPLGPFAIRAQTVCSYEECAFKCCFADQLLENKNGSWTCDWNAEDHWTPYKSSFTQVFDAEYPYKHYFRCRPLHLSPVHARHGEAHAVAIRQFHFATWETCFDFIRSSNGSLTEAFFYCEHTRITRGVYWLIRPLCVLSTLLLLASLLSIVCDKNMRQKIHGRCLASHAACLFSFNIGQVGYYTTISDDLDEEGKEDIPPEFVSACKYIALLMYYLLAASWFWLTALCVNMAMGFRLQVTRSNKESRKRFLTLSALAWGVPFLLTITSSLLLAHEDTERTENALSWYTPSLVETRTCFNEYILRKSSFSVSGKTVRIKYFTLKSGTALFYYGPVCCLVVCNVICLTKTLRKVLYLKRGNSVLRREEDQIPLGQIHTEGNNPPMAHTAKGYEKTRGGKNGSGTTVDAKTIKLYIKMLLMTGGIELLSEVIMWSTTVYKFKIYKNSANDFDLAYRTAGYVTDFFRAVVVTWLAAPDGGYLGLIRSWLRRAKGEKKSARAGDAGRRKQNVA